MLVFVACHVPAPPGGAHSPGAPVVPALPEVVSVRLQSLQEEPLLRITGAGPSEVEIWAEGLLVRASDGRAGLQLECWPARGEGQLGLAGRAYAGGLRFEVTPGGGLSVTNVVALEDYVAGVVAAELVLWSAEPAELEAQAIAARTYAVHRLRSARSLVDGVGDQAYRGRYVPESPASQRVAERLATALAASRGRILVRGGRLLDARFHAACGGHTARLEDVFPGAGPGTPAVECAPCEERARDELRRGVVDARGPIAWRWSAGPAELADLGRRLELGGPLRRVQPALVDPAGRLLRLRLDGRERERELRIAELRALVGPRALASGRWTAMQPPAGTLLADGLSIEGLGRGHGVGMCQEGARDLARRGWSAERILAHYYPGADLADGRAGPPALP